MAALFHTDQAKGLEEDYAVVLDLKKIVFPVSVSKTIRCNGARSACDR